jgi:hypothetical protein
VPEDVTGAFECTAEPFGRRDLVGERYLPASIIGAVGLPTGPPANYEPSDDLAPVIDAHASGFQDDAVHGQPRRRFERHNLEQDRGGVGDLAAATAERDSCGFFRFAIPTAASKT